MTSSWIIGAGELIPSKMTPAAPPQLAPSVTGYPFMNLARRHGIDYTDVLLAAECYQPTCKFSPSTLRLAAFARLTNHVLAEISDLMGQPVGDRGGPHLCSCGAAHFSTEPCQADPYAGISMRLITYYLPGTD